MHTDKIDTRDEYVISLYTPRTSYIFISIKSASRLESRRAAQIAHLQFYWWDRVNWDFLLLSQIAKFNF